MEYSGIRQLILKNLKGKNLSQFCTDNNISYQQFMNFKTNPKNQYLTITKKILKILGCSVIKIEKVTLYHIKTK